MKERKQELTQNTVSG